MNQRLYEAIKNRQDLADIKRKYVMGEITRDEAKKLAQPVIDRINWATWKKTQEFNAKYETRRKAYKHSFISLMR